MTAEVWVPLGVYVVGVLVATRAAGIRAARSRARRLGRYGDELDQYRDLFASFMFGVLWPGLAAGWLFFAILRAITWQPKGHRS